ITLVIRTAYSELPPPTISAANARPPRYPANQECDPPGNSASPVFPYTSPQQPGLSLAVALVTTSRIMGRSAATIFGLIGVLSPWTAVGRPAISCGTGVLPAATVAATRAIPNGLASTLPWPNPSSVRSARSTVGGTDPVTVVMPST